MTILFNIATRERPEQFAELLNNIESNLGVIHRAAIIAKIDIDDPCKSEYEAIVEKRPGIAKWGHSYNKVHAINRDIPETGWDILVNVSDDQRFIVNGFDALITEQAIASSGIFLHFPDQYKRAACCTMSIMTHAYWVKTGKKVYNEDYVSLWADMEATQVAKMLNRYKYVPNTIFRHDHYSTTGRKMDHLYKRNNTYRRDQAIYNSRKEKGFDVEGADQFPKILIKYPTRGRWRMFAEVLDNIYSTIQTHKFQIQVTADYDDPEMNSDEVKELCKRYPHVTLLFDNHESKIHACNNLMPDGDFDMIVLMSDDMRFKGFGWDTAMWKDIRSVWPGGTDYFAHFNDGYVGHKLPTLNVCGRQWYDRFGYLYHPSYKSVSCDAENMYVAQMLGRYHYFDTVYFNHEHPANLKQPSDYIYRRNHAYGKADTANYFERMKQNFGLSAEYQLPEVLKQYV